MPSIEIAVSCPVFDSFRVQQVGGMFDVPLARRATERFAVDVPAWVLTEGDGGRGTGDEGSDSPAPRPQSPAPAWSVGLIVGPSGSGKSTIARSMFGDRVYETQEWPADRAVIDGLGDRPIKEITRLFTAVGFSSPPSWIKPYRVLSNGERFRCDLARALAGEWGRGAEAAASDKAEGGGRKAEETVASGQWPVTIEGAESQNPEIPKSPNPFSSPRPLVPSPSSNLQFPIPNPSLVVFDEFTSVVDRNVARVVSAAVSKGIRAGRIGCRFVAVTCHYDVAEWLEPDWVIDMAASTFSRRRLRRPSIELEIFRCRRSAWRLFARHHYLSGALPRAARCFLALWRGEPVAFCATLTLIGQKNRWRISRIVTLPDYQGVGIGMNVAEAVADLHVREGHRMNVTASHPALIAHCRRSPKWRAVGVKKNGSKSAKKFIDNYRGSAGRAVVSFEYVGEKKRLGVRS